MAFGAKGERGQAQEMSGTISRLGLLVQSRTPLAQATVDLGHQPLKDSGGVATQDVDKQEEPREQVELNQAFS